MSNVGGAGVRGDRRTVGRRGLWSLAALGVTGLLMMPALAADSGPDPVPGAEELTWVYDEGAGRYGGWRWDTQDRRWVLVEVRQPESGPPDGGGQPADADRPTYYVDCAGGDDAATGDQAAPWRTPASLSGRSLPRDAVVYLKRGCTWDGQVRVAGEGVAVAAYGEGAAPTITATDAPREEGAVIIEAPRGSITGVLVRDTAGAGVTLAAQGATAYDMSVENVAFGIRFTAPHTLADRVHARNLHLYTSTPKSQAAEDDSGAVGFNVETTDVTVQNSTCVNCRAPSDDYGHDGGFIEIWREGDRLRAFNNSGYNVDGFLEIGGMKGSGDSIHDVLLQGNTVARVYARALYVNQDSPYEIPVTGVVLRDNVIQVVDGPAIAGDTSGVDMDDSNRIGRDVPPPVASPRSGADVRPNR